MAKRVLPPPNAATPEPKGTRLLYKLDMWRLFPDFTEFQPLPGSLSAEVAMEIIFLVAAGWLAERCTCRACGLYAHHVDG
jgi:hypothetical protein